jgi:hypothetical protein
LEKVIGKKGKSFYLIGKWNLALVHGLNELIFLVVNPSRW